MELSDLSMWTNVCGFAGAGLVIATYSMRTMIPLRIISLCSASLFLIYGLLVQSYPQILLHAVLLPLNAFRLREMTKLVSQVKQAAAGDLSMEWFCAYSTRQACREGDALFSKGDPADAMYYIASGRYLLPEIGVELGPGQVVGEIGMVAPGGRRTQSFTCLEAGEVQRISYDSVKQLYFQNPQFGFYFLSLITQRLIANNAALEARLKELERERQVSGSRRRRRAHAPQAGASA